MHFVLTDDYDFDRLLNFEFKGGFQAFNGFRQVRIMTAERL